MNYLVYLHSIWISQSQLYNIFYNTKDISYKDFFENLEFYLRKTNLFKNNKIEDLVFSKKKLNKKEIDDIIKKLDIKIITIFDANYPENLKHIKKPPFFLYVRWNIDWKDNFLWVVWSRKITNYWRKVWNHIIPKLSNYFTIVSGWAWWCDTLAHKIALENWWKTIVVFWTWIDISYPSSNHNLFEEIAKNNWALISIFPLKTSWSLYTFPIRNEIISWISKWIVILEAWEKSGTLITSNLALEQWKDVFAVPWDIFSPSSIWTNNLIKTSQAKLITSREDVLFEYNCNINSVKNDIIFENDIQKDIYNLLKFNLNLSIDEIIEKTSYTYQEISLNLSLMELQWIIKKDMFWKYTI